MTLTHQGHQFLRQAHLILTTVDNAKRSLQQSTDQVAGQLIIGVTSLVAGYYLADLLTRFQRAYPNVEIRVMEDERPYIEHLLVSGEIDVGVLILSNLEDRHALQTEVLTHSPHRLWLPAQHPRLEHDSINLADMAREPLIQLNVDEMDHNAQRMWTAAPLQPRITLVDPFLTVAREQPHGGRKPSIRRPRPSHREQHAHTRKENPKNGWRALPRRAPNKSKRRSSPLTAPSPVAGHRQRHRKTSRPLRPFCLFELKNFWPNNWIN